MMDPKVVILAASLVQEMEEMIYQALEEAYPDKYGMADIEEEHVDDILMDRIYNCAIHSTLIDVHAILERANSGIPPRSWMPCMDSLDLDSFDMALMTSEWTTGLCKEFFEASLKGTFECTFPELEGKEAQLWEQIDKVHQILGCMDLLEEVEMKRKWVEMRRKTLKIGKTA